MITLIANYIKIYVMVYSYLVPNSAMPHVA